MASIRVSERATGTRYQVLYRKKDAAGKPVQTSSSFTDPEAAAKFCTLVDKVGPDAAEATIGLGGNDTTLAEYLDRHIDELTSAHEGTRTRYRGYTNGLRNTIGALPIEALSTRAIQGWVRELQTAGAAGKTVHNKHGFLAGALNAAVREGVIPANPCDGVKLTASTRRAEPVFLTGDEVKGIASRIYQPHAPLVLWLASTGMRYSEATALTVGDINTTKRTARVNKAWKYIPKKPLELGPPKSRKSIRTVSLPATALEGINMDRPRGALLFPGHAGKPLAPSTFRMCWYRAVDDMDPRPRVHDLRHTCASWMIAAGIPLPTIQAHLGHESIQTTIGVYGHLDRSAGERAAAAIDDALS